MDLWKSMGGMISVQLTSADPAATLRAINDMGIAVYRVILEPESLTCRFAVSRQDYSRLEAAARKRGDELKILSHSGIYWKLRGLMQRRFLLLGLLALLLLSILLPTRVFFFRVEGNTEVSDRLILAAAEECGICFGVSRQKLRSEKMKNALLEAIPQLQWAGINTSGCTATITVRERQSTESSDQKNGVSSVVAARDGVIQELTVIRGNGVCRVGQAVKAGQVLISGYTDCGISIRATRAAGEVYADTERELTVLTPAKWVQRDAEKGVTKNFAFIFGKKRINLCKGSGISDASCVKMYREYYLTLPGGFQLPVALVTEVLVEHAYAESVATREAAGGMMADFARSYLSKQMVAGRILSCSELPSAGDGVLILYGKYACREMIGQVRSEEIIR